MVQSVCTGLKPDLRLKTRLSTDAQSKQLETCRAETFSCSSGRLLPGSAHLLHLCYSAVRARLQHSWCTCCAIAP